jgi:hypothetical protein
MSETENIFLTWALFSGGGTLIVATPVVPFNATRHDRTVIGTSPFSVGRLSRRNGRPYAGYTQGAARFIFSFFRGPEHQH